MILDIDEFVSRHVINRAESMFIKDISNNYNSLCNKISDKTFLVIGGAGSIGSSFIKSILPFKPKAMVVVDINENALTELTRDLRSTKEMYVPIDYITYPMNYASAVFEKMFRNRRGFDIVANFSAHKHVRSEKDVYSVEALVHNNVLNAKILLDLLAEYPPDLYFCVSTDKAANPVNIMGASKRIMEDMIFSYSDKYSVKTARFANVAFSNGSLLAGFLNRIQKFQPLSAPLDVKRYFVSLEESGQICMLSALLGDNREIFFPKLHYSQMMTFDKIATKLLEECGYDVIRCNTDLEAMEMALELKKGGNRYPVVYSKSDTSGEKLYEEFYTASEKTDMNRYISLGIITGKNIPDKYRLERLCNQLRLVFNKDIVKKQDIIKEIESYLTDFQHIETGKSLDSKM